MPTPEDILDATEDVLRRFGPEKTNVVDVARALDVSHGTLYRHFSSKDALFEAVTRRWLRQVERPLASIRDDDGPADERLHQWFGTLVSIKHEARRDDPEMFAAYFHLAQEATGVVDQHVDELESQVTAILEEGRAQGVFYVEDAETAARAVFQATARFHHPARSDTWDDPAIDEQFEAVWQLLLEGLT